MDKQTVQSCLERVIAANKPYAVIGLQGDPDLNVTSYAYSIGLTDHGLTEFIVIGPDVHKCVDLLSDMVDHCVSKKSNFEDKWVDTFKRFGGVQVRNLAPSQVDSYVPIALEFYARKGQCPQFQQVVIPDQDGNLPDDDNYDSHFMVQRYGQHELWRKQTHATH